MFWWQEWGATSVQIVIEYVFQEQIFPVTQLVPCENAFGLLTFAALDGGMLTDLQGTRLSLLGFSVVSLTERQVI